MAGGGMSPSPRDASGHYPFKTAGVRLSSRGVAYLAALQQPGGLAENPHSQMPADALVSRLSCFHSLRIMVNSGMPSISMPRMGGSNPIVGHLIRRALWDHAGLRAPAPPTTRARVSRYYATIRLLSSHHHFVLSFSVVTARGCPRAEAERSPRVRTQNFVPSPSPLRAPPDGIWASPPGGGSPCGWRASSALRLCSVRHCTSDFHWTALAVPPLVSLVMGSFRHGPKWTFTSCSAPMPGALRAASLRSAARPAAQRPIVGRAEPERPPTECRSDSCFASMRPCRPRDLSAVPAPS